MWPMLLDYSDDECRRILRKLELEAYASIISAFRAQGELNKEKRKMLQELSVALSITIDRHRAEVRRAVNDEQLNTVADRTAGPNTTTEWAIEGRRAIPLMPRLIPQTAYTAIANLAADAQSSKNATLPIPSETGMKGFLKDSENVVPSRKRHLTPEPSEVPEKFTILEKAPATSSPIIENTNGESSEPFSHCSSPVQPPFTGKDASAKLATPKASASGVASPLIQPAKLFTTTTVSSATSFTSTVKSSLAISKSTAVTTVTTTTTATPSAMPFVKPAPVTSAATATSVAENASASLAGTMPSDPQSASLNPSPLFSSPGGYTQSVNTLPNVVSSAFVARTRAKVPLIPKPLMRPRLSPGSVFGTPSPALPFQNSPQLATPTLVQTVNKTASPLKFRSSSNTPVPSSVPPSATPHSQTTTLPLVSPRPQSPIASLSRVTLPSSGIHRTPSPVIQKQTPVTISTVTKPTVNTKILAKPTTVRPTLSAKPVVTTVTKSKNPVIVSTTQARTTLPLSVKTTFPAQIIGNTSKSSATITYSQKMLPGPSQVKVTPQPIAKTIHYRNEGGLKIISQGVPGNRILPKPPLTISTQTLPTSSTRLITTATTSTGLPGSARIVNFTQPLNARFARALPPSSIGAVNLVNNLPVGGLRVALPMGVGNSPVMRSTIPAKPNVIVVHKAQVWPQAPGATIVMTSTGSLSRLSNEAIEEAVTIMQRQDTGRHTGTATGFKTLTVHHGSASMASQNTATQSKPAQGIGCKTTDSIFNRGTIKSKILKSDVTPSTILLSDNQKDLPPRKDLTLPLRTAIASSSLVSTTMEKFVEGSLLSKKFKLSSRPSTVMIKTAIEDPSKDKSRKTLIETKIVEKHDDDTVSTKVSIPDFSMEQLQEGQILELRKGPTVRNSHEPFHQQLNKTMEAQDAAEVLGQHGKLSTEVIELLHRVGLQVDHVEAPDATPQVPAGAVPSNSAVGEPCEKPLIKPKESSIETVLSNDPIDVKSDIAGTPSASGKAELIQVSETSENQNRESLEGKSKEAPPAESSSTEASNGISQGNREGLASLRTTETLGDSPTSLSSLNSPIVLDDMDNNAMRLPSGDADS